jgi:hypothetical protein
MRYREKDYAQIINNVEQCELFLLQPMNVRALLQLDTKAAYDLFNTDKTFPSIKIHGKNYIIRDNFVNWVRNTYGQYIE